MKTGTVLFCFICLLNTFCASAQGPTTRPNIILIIADDLRYDAFSVTGGPDFLNTPSINKIANEGARFDNYYCVYPLCIPARAAMMTGLYPHSNGAVDNCTFIQPGIKTLAQVLDSAGYHTGMIGKYHINTKKQIGWDYWFVTSRHIDYVDPTFYFNDTKQFKSGHVETIIYDTVQKYLSEVDTPFFVTIGHPSPHRPVVPLPQYEGIFAGIDMPVPENFFPFSAWYPSYLYSDSGSIYNSEMQVEKDLQNYFSGILAVEDNVTDVFSILEERNLLNNTMIIFTSDNGAIYGEHMLIGKGKAFDPSIHLPLFIRYPAWYQPNTVVDNFFTLNIDIMPTILEVAKIDPDQYHMQGTSFQKQIAGEVQRNAFLFENIKLAIGTCEDIEDSFRPSIRGVITNDFKYVKNQCDHLTEELYDLNADPLETTNLVMKPNYQNALNYLRAKLTELKLQYFDTLQNDNKIEECSLVKCNPNTIDHFTVDDIIPWQVIQDPAKESLKISGDFIGETNVTIINLMGQVAYEHTFETSMQYENIDLAHFPSGMYLIVIFQGGNRIVKSFWKN
ncbi:MAG: sulfatase-like hydrolase/transferase [Chitinophagales bacterium]